MLQKGASLARGASLAERVTYFENNPMPSFSDRLAEAVRPKGPLCVGIDPRWESLPKSIRDKCQMPTGPDEVRVPLAFTEFAFRVLELVAPHSAVVKPQAAFFELFGPLGMKAMQRVLQRAK